MKYRLHPAEMQRQIQAVDELDDTDESSGEIAEEAV